MGAAGRRRRGRHGDARRSRNVQRLVTYGIFGWVRNPLYVGNFFIWMGFVVISGVLWFLPVAIVIFAIEYTLIVAYEEGVLESIFGQEYLDYKRTTPRWIPASAHGAREWPARLGRGVAQRRSARSCSTRRCVVVFIIKQRTFRLIAGLSSLRIATQRIDSRCAPGGHSARGQRDRTSARR